MVNMKASQYVPIHSKQIRGLSFNRQNDSLLLSAALDNTIKLTRYEHVGLSLGGFFLFLLWDLYLPTFPCRPFFQLLIWIQLS